MHANYSFHFLETVSKQLVAELETLSVTLLDAAALAKLAVDQASSNAHQGVYLLHLTGQPVYLGKADDVHDRLKQHLRKLSGRQNIDLSQVGYKALLLDKSMSTAANETVLIALVETTMACGMGPDSDQRTQGSNVTPPLLVGSIGTIQSKRITHSLPFRILRR